MKRVYNYKNGSQIDEDNGCFPYEIMEKLTGKDDFSVVKGNWKLTFILEKSK